jgi:hypothetical protein
VRRWWLISLCVMWSATPASAAWLVLRDGKPIATSGPWQTGDNQLTYNQPDGKRVTVMLVVVDPDATRLANVPGAPSPTANPQRKRFVISNETVKGSKTAPGSHERATNAQDLSALLSTISDCLTRFPNSAADYNRCCAPPANPR